MPLSVIAELSCLYVRRNVNSTWSQFRTWHGFEATDAASISPMIPIADIVSASRC